MGRMNHFKNSEMGGGGGEAKAAEGRKLGVDG